MTYKLDEEVSIHKSGFGTEIMCSGRRFHLSTAFFSEAFASVLQNNSLNVMLRSKQEKNQPNKKFKT